MIFLKGTEQTEFGFNNNDQQWNQFVLTYNNITNKIGKYTRHINNAFALLCILYLVGTYTVISYNLSNSTTLYNISILSDLLPRSAPYIVIYFLAVRYIVPYGLTYYSIKNKVNLNHILFKQIKTTTCHNILILFLQLLLGCSFLYLYIYYR
jgi:hypothetical protein